MLYHFLYPLHTHFSFFNIFRYITFRCIYATITALLISFFAGPYLIRRLKIHQIGQAIRKDGPASHLKKEGTPTMGGLLILISIILPTLLWAELTNPYIWIVLSLPFASACWVSLMITSRSPGKIPRGFPDGSSFSSSSSLRLSAR